MAHVQFRSLEEQLFRAIAVLFDQKQRQGVVRLVGMNAPVSLFTPTIDRVPGSPERTTRFLARCYEKLPFALSRATAQKQVTERGKHFAETLFQEVAAEVNTTKRRIR